MVSSPRPDPFTNHRPANPCTPRLSGRRPCCSVAEATAVLGKRHRKAQPICTRTSSPFTSNYALDGGRSKALDRIAYQVSNRIGNRCGVVVMVTGLGHQSRSCGLAIVIEAAAWLTTVRPNLLADCSERNE